MIALRPLILSLVLVTILSHAFADGGARGATVIYDLNADWSDASNPNGVWAYREGLNPLPHVDDFTELGATVVQPAWTRFGTNPNFLPAWFKSTSDNPGGLDFLTGDVVVHSTDTFRGPMGDANVTWTSLVNDTIYIAGEAWQVKDLDDRGNTWRLLLNGTPFTEGHIYSGDPFSRAQPFDFSAGSGGPSALNGIAVSAGDEIRLDVIADEPDLPKGYLVGVNLSIIVDPPPCAAFDGLNLALQDDTVLDTQTFEVCDTIEVGPNYEVAGPGGNLTLRAGNAVIFSDGTSVGVDGQLSVEIDPSLLSRALKQ